MTTCSDCGRPTTPGHAFRSVCYGRCLPLYVAIIYGPETTEHDLDTVREALGPFKSEADAIEAGKASGAEYDVLPLKSDRPLYIPRPPG